MDQNDSNNQTSAQDVVQDKEQSTSQNDNSVMGQSATQDENTAVEQSASQDNTPSKDSAVVQSVAPAPAVNPVVTNESAPQQAQLNQAVAMPQQAQPNQMGPVSQQIQPSQAGAILQQAQPNQANAAATTVNTTAANPSPVRKKIDHNKIRDAFGTVGLVAGIIAIFPTFTIPRLQYFSYVLAILSIVFSLICLIRRRMGVIPILGVMIGLLAFGLVLTQSDVLHHVGHNYDNPYANNK